MNVNNMDINVDLIVLILAITVVAMLKGYEFQLNTKHIKLSLTTPITANRD